MKIKKEVSTLNDDVEVIEANQDYTNNSMIGKTITRAFNAKTKDLGDGVMEAIISSESLDRHGEKIDLSGMNISEYIKNNPVIAEGHDYSQPSLGKALKLTKTPDGKLIARFQWAKDWNDKAKMYYNLYREGFQNAFSIGFIVEKMDGNTYTKSTMIEFSPVLIPANAEAVLLKKLKGIDTDKVLTYNIINMQKLKKILSKKLEDITLSEVKYLQAHISELDEDMRAKFGSVLGDDIPLKEEPEKEEEEKKEEPEKVEEEDEKEDEKPEEEKEEEAEEEKVEDEKEEDKEDLTEEVKKLRAEVDKLKKIDPVAVKNLHGQTSEYGATLKAKMNKETKFLYYVKGVMSGNFGRYAEVVGKEAMNTTDDGVLLPPIEFIAEVERLEEEYGVAMRYAQVRRSTNGTGIKFLQGADDVEIFDTAEGAVKKSSKLSYQEKLLAWRKFAGITPITDELSEDSAIDLWADATSRYARAFAKREDELVFTEDAGASPINAGILKVAGTHTVEVPSFDGVTYDDFVDMLVGVPTMSAASGRFYFHRELLSVLMKIKDDEGRPIWLPSVATGQPATILGKPYELVEVMPNLADEEAGLSFLIFGDLRYATYAERTGLTIVIRDTGIVTDPEDEQIDLNLFTQDMKAMRAVKRMNAVVRYPEAFSVMKVASGS